jgi:hypothetical protein
MTRKNTKKLRNSCLEVLQVLYRGLKATPVVWTSFQEA